MSLSKYPKRLDLFQVKKNAQFDGDPNGDFVMADDVNQLQDAVSAIEKALGIEPQGNKTSVGERISLLEGSSSLRVPSFLIYLGKPALINDSETYLEAAGHFAKYDHVVLGQSAQDPSDPDYAVTLQIIETVRASKDVKFYGYVDCGVNTANLSVAELQIAIGQWKDIDASGVYCANFGFESRVSRDRQNEILDSIHQHDMVAILDAASPKEVFSDLFHETMNPNWIKPHTKNGDAYHLNKYCLDTSRTTAVFEPNVMGEIMKLIALYEYRVNDGIRIFGTPVIQTNIDKETAQRYYDYAHASALVTSLDAFHPVTEGYSAATNMAPTYDWVPIAGSWYMDSPRVEYDDQGILCIRETPFGRIILNTQEHTYRYEGIYIPYSLLQIAANTIEGTLLKDASIEDIKIKDYQGGRLIDAINAELDEAKRIDIAKIMKMDYSNLEGSIPVDVLKANVIQAINANIGFATIGGAVIGELTAGHITSGTIDAGRITASVVEALNLYAENMEVGSAVIGEAVIGDLSAEKITAGNIDAERIQAGVVEAINLSAKQADIQNLNADNITAGNIKAERIQAEVINAINLYAQSAVIGKAVITSAVVGDMTAGHIRASVIEAVNSRTDFAVINSAKIGELKAEHIQASVIEALAANIGTATIDAALINNLDASKITAGTIDVDRLIGSVVSAVNLTAENATIRSAVIGDLEAEKITTGSLKAQVMESNVVSAINAYAQTITAGDAVIESAVIGQLTAEHIKASVIEAINLYAASAVIDKATIQAAAIGSLEAENIKAAVFEAIDANITNAQIKAANIGSLSAENMKAAVFAAIDANITNAKINGANIGELTAGHITSGSIDTSLLVANVVKAINAELQTAQIQEAKIVDLSAEKIVTGDIKAELLTANVVAAINAELQNAQIDEAKIGNLSATKITAGDIDAARMTANVVAAVNAYVANMVAGTAVIDSAAIGTLDAEHMQAKVLSAINASIETINAQRVVIDSAKIGQLTADHIKASVIEAVNASLDTAKIRQGVIEDLSAEKIVAGSLKAEVMTANAIAAINADLTTATIDAAQIGSLSAEHIQAEIIEAINASIESATIDAAQIGQLDVSNIQAAVISAINASIGTATIDAAKIGSLKAENIETEVIKAINASIESVRIGAGKIGTLTADHIKTSVIEAVNGSLESAKIGFARIGALKAENIEADAITATAIKSDSIQTRHILTGNVVATHISSNEILARHIKAGEITTTHITTAGLNASIIKSGYIDAARIQVGSIEADRLVASSITSLQIAAKSLTSREIQSGSITSDEIRAGSIKAEHITTEGLDANHISVYNSKTGETLIGGGYLRVDGLDAGVVQSDNLVANGMFMTASSGYGIKRTNPTGEVIIGTESKVGGGNQIWKYDLDTGLLVTTIDIPGKKPAFIAIDGEQKYGYVTVQGDDTVVQIDLDFDVLTDNYLPMGKAPSRIKWTGNLLGDMKHLFVVNSDQTDVNAPDSFFVLDVPPHSDFSQLYVHHQLVLGNGPYDFVVSNKDKRIYITQKDQGDIAVFDASNMVTWNWKQIGAIPIAPYGTDNYHGGMESGYGLGHAVGGASSAEYNLNAGHAGHSGMSHGSHGGYGVSDGSMKKYEPRGIALDTNENLLLVADAENNELVVVMRVPKEEFEWPVHTLYTEHSDWIETVKAATLKYDNNPELAVADGYTMMSPFVPYMGYHFANTTAPFSNTMPNTLMYIFDTTVNQYKLIGAEWVVTDPTIPSPVPGMDWVLNEPAMATYADGLVIQVDNPEAAPPVHPETGSAFVSWRPALYGIHFYHMIQNPLGLFETFNPRLEPYVKTNPQFPPGFESYVNPNMSNSNYHEYVAPAGAGGGMDHGGGGHNHAMSAMSDTVIEEEQTFNALHTNHQTAPVEDEHAGHDMGGGPDTTGQGTVWRWVMQRIPIGDSPEFITVDHDKVFVTLQGSDHVVVLNVTDLYRTEMDIQVPTDWNRYLRDIVVGPKPLEMIVDPTRMRLYVTVTGTNQIAVVNPMTETVESFLPAGANVMGGAITPDGKYLYVANNGGVGSLSFVYPPGPYIGDAFIGLEGDINYQGADRWIPDRSDWVHNLDGTLRSSSSVEFRINEPFLNEGGYVKLSTQGVDGQYAQIEQDIFNVSNYSNGDNFADAKAERLEGNFERTLWYPSFKWLQSGGVSNIKVVEMVEQEDESVLRVETIPAPTSYIIHYDTPRIEIQAGVVPAGAWIEADYVFRANVWFKNHNASILLAIENSSSKNFNTFFEVDEFVPKFITIDALQTKAFDYLPIVNPGTTESHFHGLKYSHITNRAQNMVAENIALSAAQIDTGAGVNPSAAVDGDTSSNTYVQLPSGLQSMTLDLGGKFMVGAVKVWHFWQDGRMYHENKTQVSEDGVTWKTLYDSAVDGEYVETKDGFEMKLWAYDDREKNYDVNYVAAQPIRYVRNFINGNTVNANNQWVEMQVFADWELEEDYLYPENTTLEGQQIATNGKGVVTSDIPAASITIDLKVDFTSWWYMTYLVGPDFGAFDVEMPTVMGGSHVLPLGNPYINKVAHKHIMNFPPGVHTAVIKQRSGKVAIDRFRFEDYQYFDRSATLIPSNAGTTFTRYKIVPEQARDYVGTGNQSTEGPYDVLRVNPDTRQPDGSVSVKYRFRVKSVLTAAGEVDERGVAYLTSAIFEQGKLSSHWRPSSASDMTPGNRIESWDGNQPHKTGIQWFHLANGSVRGTKILPSAIMDYHVSPYAKIGEYKLDLNYPTHRHGHTMTYADGTTYFMDNKHVIDTIMAWGTSGTQNIMARADHGHEHLDTKLTIHGPFRAIDHGADGTVTTWHTINGVEIVGFKQAFDSHLAATELHFSATERTKLSGIAEGATKVQASTNGKVLINGVDTTVYSHPTGAGNNHVPTGGVTGNYLKWSSNGVAAWVSVAWSDVTSKPTTFTPPIATASVLGGVKPGAGLTLGADGTLTWAHATGTGNSHIPSGGVAANILRWSADGIATWGNVAWTEVTGKPTTFAPTAHTHTASEITDLNTVLSSYATKEELNAAGEVKLATTNTFTGQNIFTKADGPAIVVKPSSAPAANTVLFQLLNTGGSNLVTMDAEGDVVINANLTVQGTTTYNGTNTVDGNYDVTGNLSVGGNSTLGDALTDQTLVKGDLVVEGNIKPKGRSVEVGKFTVFGTAGDLQFQTDSTVFEEVVSHYSTFQSGDSWPVPAAQAGATRKYRLVIAYSTVGTASAAQLKITQYGGADITTFNLPEVNGSATGMVRHFRTAEFTTAYVGHTTFKAISAGVNKDVVIKHIEVIAYDYFA